VRDVTLTLGVNDRAQLAEAGRLLNARTVRRWQLEGATIQDPATTWIDVTATLAPDVTVLPNTHILRASAVASGATIGPDTTLEDCEVGENATVRRSDATLAVIGAGATVGPFAYLRPGTVLAAGGKIGTFVETKNSTIGEGSKVPHLSYIGDTTIGRGVNLGAARSPRTTTTSRSTAPRSATRCTPARTTCSSRPLGSEMAPRPAPAR
jgi:bifunctional UDP-N-acetylglucosamine pyrophosphorylase/glucosamine-1-phosphate N-acetyltransferase